MLKNEQSRIILFLDFSKAFDSLSTYTKHMLEVNNIK